MTIAARKLPEGDAMPTTTGTTAAERKPTRLTLLLRGCGVLAILAGLVGAVAATVATRKAEEVPEFYRIASAPPADAAAEADRVESLAADAAALNRLFAGPRPEASPAPESDDPGAATEEVPGETWTFRASGDQLNAWLNREFAPGGKFWDYVPIGMSTPRLGLEEGAARIGVRYERAGVGGVLSVRVRGTPETETRVRFDVDRVRVGSIPATAVLRAVADELGPTLDVSPEAVRIGREEAGSGISIWLELAELADDPPAVDAIEVTEGAVTVTGRVDRDAELPTTIAAASGAVTATR